jgi:hypothetical protein
VDGNRTVGMIVNQAKAAPAAGAGK